MHGQDVMNLAYSYVRNYHQAQDIAQDVFLKAYAKMDTFRKDSSTKTWLLAITANCCRDHLRSWAKRHESFDDMAIAVESAPDDTEHAVADRLAKDALWQAVLQLPVLYREVLILYYQRELSSQEVSQVLSISEQSVRTRLHRGRLILREILTQRGEVHGAD